MSVDDTTLDALVKELDGLNAELRLPVGNATDEELRDLGMKILARFNDGWPTIKAALSATQARADKLEAELAEAKRALDDALSERDACYTVMRDFRETIQPVIPNARLMFFFSIAEEILAQHQRAEARAAAMREALESVNKLIEWERENGTHFALLESEVPHVSRLWTDAKNAVTRALQEGN